MRLGKVISACVLVTVCGIAQTRQGERPVSLDVLVEGLGDPDLVEVPVLVQEILRRGIDFDLRNKLGAVLSASAKGKRDPEQIAALLASCWDACELCRARFLAPMTSEELKNLLKSSLAPEAVFREVRARGVKDLEISEPAANMWRKAGASQELIDFLVPDDQIPALPVVGYKPIPLKHAEEYDPAAPKGWLKTAAQMPANSQSEFIFQHNALFVRAVKGEEPSDVVAYFNRPTPRNTAAELVDFNWGLEGAAAAPDEKRGGLLGLRKGKAIIVAPAIEASYLVARDDGRNAFRIVLTNKDMNPQLYSFYLRWELLTTPKVAAPAPKR